MRTWIVWIVRHVSCPDLRFITHSTGALGDYPYLPPCPTIQQRMSSTGAKKEAKPSEEAVARHAHDWHPETGGGAVRARKTAVMIALLFLEGACIVCVHRCMPEAAFRWRTFARQRRSVLLIATLRAADRITPPNLFLVRAQRMPTRMGARRAPRPRRPTWT